MESDLTKSCNFSKILYDIGMGWAEALGPPRQELFLPFILFEVKKVKELSIFIDESGNFGKCTESDSNYIVSLVFHEQINL